jgi:hypothetical protein
MPNQSPKSFEDIRKQLNDLIASSDNSPKVIPPEPKSADEKIKEIKARGLEQDIDLKKDTLKKLFLFLFIETVVIFIFSFLQATKIFRFSLEEWSFKLLVSATLLQITYMLQVAVKHLFPTKTTK